MAAGPAGAQADDDVLAPLVPRSKPKPKPKRRYRPPPKPPAAAPTPKPGELRVRVAGNLKGASLFVDEQERGVLPLPPLVLPAGEHVVWVMKPGFSEFRRKVVVPPGRPADVLAVLEPVAAVVSVATDTPGAEILVDGKSWGSAPATALLLEPGAREFMLRKDGLASAPQKVTLRVGREYSLRFSLQPAEADDRPARVELAPSDEAFAEGPVAELGRSAAPTEPALYQRWYFWAGAAAVVAATVTTLVVVNQESPVDRAVRNADAVLRL